MHLPNGRFQLKVPMAPSIDTQQDSPAAVDVIRQLPKEEQTKVLVAETA